MSSPLSSQMSALLFSSPNPQAPPSKTAKLENDSMSCGFEMSDEDDLAELLVELDKEEKEKEKENLSGNVTNNPKSNVWNESESYSLDLTDLTQSAEPTEPTELTEPQVSNCTNIPTVAYYSPTNPNEFNFSPSDSLYNSSSVNSKLLPMIDMTTPQIFSQIPPQVNKTIEVVSIDATARLLLPETFDLEDLRFNLRLINELIHLNPIEAIKSSSSRKINFPLGLMLRDFRQMGTMAQLRLIDGSGSEIMGTLPFSVTEELKFKLHFGLIFILIDVSWFHL